MTLYTHSPKSFETAIHQVREFAIAHVMLMARQLLTQVSITSGRSIAALTAEDIVDYLHGQGASTRRLSLHQCATAFAEHQQLGDEAIAPQSTLPHPCSAQRSHRSQDDFQQSLAMLDALFQDVSADHGLS